MAKIGDYSERALRKQWLNMVQRYRIQKSNMRVTPLNKQCIDALNKEWEFFGEIHAYMTQRTTDLHSYALKEPNADQSNNNLAVRGVINDHSSAECSSKPSLARNTKNTTDASESPTQAAAADDEEQCNKLEEPAQQFSPADTFNDWDSQGSSEPSDPVAVEVSDLSETESIAAKSAAAAAHQELHQVRQATASEAAKSGATPLPTTPKRKRKALTEREKYYRHRRRFEHRMEVRLGGLCIVAGQLLEHLVPEMNVTPLLMNIYNNVDYTCDSSCDDDDTDSDENDDDNDNDNVDAGSGKP